MTDCGFCVVAALSSQTSGFPWIRSWRIGKSFLIVAASKMPGAAINSGANSVDVTGARSIPAGGPAICMKYGTDSCEPGGPARTTGCVFSGFAMAAGMFRRSLSFRFGCGGVCTQPGTGGCGIAVGDTPGPPGARPCAFASFSISAANPAKSNGSLVVMVLADVDALEAADGVVGQNRSRAVERDEVLRRSALVDAHVANGQRRRGFARDA